MTRTALKSCTTEIIEDLQSALEELQAISEVLGQTSGAQEGAVDE
jgi:hypothetical protein